MSLFCWKFDPGCPRSFLVNRSFGPLRHASRARWFRRATLRLSGSASDPPARTVRFRWRTSARSDSNSGSGKEGIVLGQQVGEREQIGHFTRIVEAASLIGEKQFPGRYAPPAHGFTIELINEFFPRQLNCSVLFDHDLNHSSQVSPEDTQILQPTENIHQGFPSEASLS